MPDLRREDEVFPLHPAALPPLLDPRLRTVDAEVAGAARRGVGRLEHHAIEGPAGDDGGAVHGDVGDGPFGGAGGAGDGVGGGGGGGGDGGSEEFVVEGGDEAVGKVGGEAVPEEEESGRGTEGAEGEESAELGFCGSSFAGHAVGFALLLSETVAKEGGGMVDPEGVGGIGRFRS